MARIPAAAAFYPAQSSARPMPPVKLNLTFVEISSGLSIYKNADGMFMFARGPDGPTKGSFATLQAARDIAAYMASKV
jgi:hypothetical protein